MEVSNRFKTIVKRVLPEFLWPAAKRAMRFVNRVPDARFPLEPPLPLPPNVSEEQLRAFLGATRVSDAPEDEMRNYCNEDFRRFVYTYGLVADCTGRALELGANPYFMTMLLRHFTSLELTLANYFGPTSEKRATQSIHTRDFSNGQPLTAELPFHIFNIEADRFPFEDASFDVVLYCEIIEHLLTDPIFSLSEVKRVLKPSGVLVVTTPNVARLENVARFIAGANIYDPYSGYGPYGRHNREYNRHELAHLLDHLGFDLERAFTADVHANAADHFSPVRHYAHLLRFRENDLGQYIFVRARNARPAKATRPRLLFRSYPANDLE